MPDRILVVDDEENPRNLARMILEGKGYDVSTATNGEEAIQRTDTDAPDLILLDVVMPGRSGFEICKQLKSQTKTKHIPVVMFSALGREVDRKLGAEAGANGHFLKPFTPADLVTEVNKYVDQSRADKFSKQLGVEHGRLRSKVLLLEFDSSTPYYRLVRDFALEYVIDSDVVALTKRGGAVRRALEGDKGLELVDVAPDSILSPILDAHQKRPLSLIYDNLTDLALSTNPSNAYKFASKAVELLSQSNATALFLLNPSAHEPRDVYSLKGLFTFQMAYGKDGVTDIRIT